MVTLNGSKVVKTIKVKTISFLTMFLFVTSVQAKELSIYGGSDRDIFLGCLICNEFRSDSVCNGFGTYGNEFSGSGMFNEFAGFGNEYSSKSPWNEYSSSDEVPVVVGKDGTFYGYFTINEYRTNAVEFAGEMYKWFKYYDGNIEKVRRQLCNYFGYSG